LCHWIGIPNPTGTSATKAGASKLCCFKVGRSEAGQTRGDEEVIPLDRTPPPSPPPNKQNTQEVDAHRSRSQALMTSPHCRGAAARANSHPLLPATTSPPENCRRVHRRHLWTYERRAWSDTTRCFRSRSACAACWGGPGGGRSCWMTHPQPGGGPPPAAPPAPGRLAPHFELHTYKRLIRQIQVHGANRRAFLCACVCVWWWWGGGSGNLRMVWVACTAIGLAVLGNLYFVQAGKLVLSGGDSSITKQNLLPSGHPLPVTQERNFQHCKKVASFHCTASWTGGAA